MKEDMKSPFHDDQEAQAYLNEHVFYEFWMFVETTRYLGRLSLPAGDVLKNALIESCVLHLRNLIEFFYAAKGGRKDDDVGAEHYGWKPLTMSKILKFAQTRSHKEMAHLTTKRIAGLLDEKKIWEFRPLIDEITLLFQGFLSDENKDKINKETRIKFTELIGSITK